MSSSEEEAAAVAEKAAERLAACTERLSASGIPLAEAVRTVVQPLTLRPLTLGELAEAVQDNKVLTLNRGRIITTWGGPRSRWAKTGVVPRQWDDVSAARLAEDILTHLEEPRLGLVFRNHKEQWELTDRFDPFERYVLLTPSGKQLTHLRLREKETRQGRKKLAEARLLLVDAARLTREAGVEAQEVTEFFAGLQRLLSREEVFDLKPRGNSPRVITPDQPPDQLNLFIPCIKCKTPKPQAREFYEVYWDAGKWYWRRDCKECRRKAKLNPKAVENMEKIREFILGFVQEFHYPPTIKQVSKRMGIQGNSVRYAWKMLVAADSEFPPVPLPIADQK